MEKQREQGNGEEVHQTNVHETQEKKEKIKCKGP